MITFKDGEYFSTVLCLCSICDNSPGCKAIHGMVQVCYADGSFNRQCSKFLKKQNGRGYACPCNRKEIVSA